MSLLMIIGPDRGDPRQRPRLLLARPAREGRRSRTAASSWARSWTASRSRTPGTPEHNKRHRLQLKVGNRDLLGFDFKWIDEDQIVSRERPSDVVYVERREYGPLLGTPAKLVDAGRTVAEGAGGGVDGRRSPTWPRPPSGPQGAAQARAGRDRRHQLPHRAGPARAPQAGPGGGAREGRRPRRRTAELAALAMAAEQEQAIRQKQEELQRLVESTSRSYPDRGHRGRPGEGAAHRGRLPRLPPQPADGLWTAARLCAAGSGSS